MNSDSTIELIRLALDTAIMRETAIARNIAQVDTVNNRAVEVNFEQQLPQDSLSNSSFEEIQPFYQLSDRTIAIDEQIALSVKNATHYRALIKGLNQKFAIMKLALQGNNQS